MSKKLFVSNLDFEVTPEKLKEMFSEFGECLSLVLAVDRETKRSKGFAFIEMDTDEAAENAIAKLNNKLINNRPMKVVEDKGKTGSSTGAPGGGMGGRSSAPTLKKFEQLPPIQRMQLFKRRKKLDPFAEDASKKIDYKDVTTLSRFLSERGKILSRRLTGLSAYNQRKVSKAIKRAQNMGLIPYSAV
jgi:small subunit ribosomal protein S18